MLYRIYELFFLYIKSLKKETKKSFSPFVLTFNCRQKWSSMNKSVHEIPNFIVRVLSELKTI
jgi:hypothetical protein